MMAFMLKRSVFMLFLAASAACSQAPAEPQTVAEFPDMNVDRIMGDIRKLSSDEFEGRLPGTKGEQLTVEHLVAQFKQAGLEPGNPNGSWTQKVSLVGLTPQPTGLVVKKGGTSREFKPHAEVVGFSKHVAPEARIENSELVFAGYGVQAPEFNWNDFGPLDIRGKTLIVLVNDPPVTKPDGTLDDKTFGGKAMTYYGRWTYKYEKAAELGAAGIFIVHETEPAGYAFNVVQGMGAERFDLVTPDKNMGRSAIEGWLSVEAATELLKMAGQDYQKLKAHAATPDFKAIPLGMTATMGVTQKMRTIESDNVIAKLTGSDPVLKNEFVLYTAHWDHLGVKTSGDGDRINNGALDNASGTALVLEMARAFKSLRTPPKRTMLFLMVTAEEQGLLGSQYYAEFPLYPLEKTLAVINIDGVNQWGRTSDLTVVGLGASELDDYARTAATEQQRTLTPDPEAEKGFYYRSDHFNFAKKGVPAFYPDTGVNFVGKSAEYSQQKRDEYTRNDYHGPTDEVKPDWDLTGAADDGKLLMAMGYRIANAAKYPEWRAGNEFRAIREKTLRR
jgi:Zn-dependent M28 family amino/carboxypeptidase